jgi:hypothetical protein
MYGYIVCLKQLKISGPGVWRAFTCCDFSGFSGRPIALPPRLAPPRPPRPHRALTCEHVHVYISVCARVCVYSIHVRMHECECLCMCILLLLPRPAGPCGPARHRRTDGLPDQLLLPRSAEPAARPARQLGRTDFKTAAGEQPGYNTPPPKKNHSSFPRMLNETSRRAAAEFADVDGLPSFLLRDRTRHGP